MVLRLRASDHRLLDLRRGLGGVQESRNWRGEADRDRDPPDLDGDDCVSSSYGQQLQDRKGHRHSAAPTLAPWARAYHHRGSLSLRSMLRASWLSKETGTQPRPRFLLRCTVTQTSCHLIGSYRIALQVSTLAHDGLPC